MDLSALIFVALAVAWAVYLIPKALRQHEDGAASRSIDGFSDRMRVLARREAVDAKSARLVVPGRPATAIEAEPIGAAEALMTRVAEPAATLQRRARRASAARAAKRRLRVVCVILVGLVAVSVVAALGHIAALYTSIPAGVLVAWLVACRVMVKHERAAYVPAPRRTTVAPEADVDDDDPLTEEIAVVEAEVVSAADPVAESPTAPAPGGWDPVPVTLPTYVGKEPAARRSVRTIDLDSTGVWSSGPSASDSAIARGAEQAERTARSAAAEAERRRASGS